MDFKRFCKPLNFASISVELYGDIETNGSRCVYIDFLSYGVVIARYSKQSDCKRIYFDIRKYSATTTIHQGLIGAILHDLISTGLNPEELFTALEKGTVRNRTEKRLKWLYGYIQRKDFNRLLDLIAMYNIKNK